MPNFIVELEVTETHRMAIQAVSRESLVADIQRLLKESDSPEGDLLLRVGTLASDIHLDSVKLLGITPSQTSEEAIAKVTGMKVGMDHEFTVLMIGGMK